MRAATAGVRTRIAVLALLGATQNDGVPATGWPDVHVSVIGLTSIMWQDPAVSIK